MDTDSITDVNTLDVNKDGKPDFLVFVGMDALDNTKGRILVYGLPMTSITPLINIQLNRVPAEVKDLPTNWVPILAGEIPGASVLFTDGTSIALTPNSKSITNFVNPANKAGLIHFTTFEIGGDNNLDHFTRHIELVPTQPNLFVATHSLTIHRNNGDGTSTAIQTLSLSTLIDWIVPGDYDGDGDTDLVAVQKKIVNGVYTYEFVASNNNNGVFTDMASIPSKKACDILAKAGATGLTPVVEQQFALEVDPNLISNVEAYPVFKFQAVQIFNFVLSVVSQFPTDPRAQDFKNSIQEILNAFNTGNAFIGVPQQFDHMAYSNRISGQVMFSNLFLTPTGEVNPLRFIEFIYTSGHEGAHLFYDIDDPDAYNKEINMVVFTILTLGLFNSSIAFKLDNSLSMVFRNNRTYYNICKAFLESTFAPCGGTKDFNNEKNNIMNQQSNQPVYGYQVDIDMFPKPGSTGCNPKKIKADFKIYIKNFFGLGIDYMATDPDFEYTEQ
ncbi:MAG: VCBS repeat-containing protein [Planctomycetes bacterium]|nr:VCBS repeat-containing protein [Planctomycetota bacterium]